MAETTLRDLADSAYAALDAHPGRQAFKLRHGLALVLERIGDSWALKAGRQGRPPSGIELNIVKAAFRLSQQHDVGYYEKDGWHVALMTWEGAHAPRPKTDYPAPEQ
jgi:hypothetical protein